MLVSILINLFAAPLLTGAYSAITSFVHLYGYLAIVVLMALESASLPIPSEVILPLAGHFIALGEMNPYLAVIATIIGTAIGISFDYAVAYLLGKELIYKHLHSFHIQKRMLDHFDRWFAENGSFAVFVSRLLPVIRGLISFPAGFAQMPLRKFYLYSLTGALIWNVALMAFGYYALSITNLQLLLGVVAAFAIVLYLIYHISLKRIRRK